MKTPIYLDYSATTPIDPRVAEKMIPYLVEKFGNPASRSHAFGWEADEAVEAARAQVAALVNADPKEIVWTSGATESNNLAIKGAANFYAGTKGKHIITVKTEHKAVLDTVRELERQGFEATYLDVQDDGLISLDALKAAIRPDTVVISVMFVNNEIGVVQPIAEIGELCREKGIVFHVDAAQATGKVDIDLSKLKVDLMSFSAHKTYGPQRIGALRDRLLEGLSSIEATFVNGDLVKRVPHNLNISFAYVEGESLIMAIKDVAVSSGSACTSASLEPSYVLRALGRNDELAHSSIRFTLGRFTTVEEIDYTIDLLHQKIGKLRELSPLWEMGQEGVDLSTVQG